MRSTLISHLCLVFLFVPLPVCLAGYDPLAASPKFDARQLDWVVHDAKRDRNIPVLIYLPTNATPQPVVLFSHGLGGTRQTCKYLGEHWAARGYVAVFVQHPGSDDSVWRSTAPRNRMKAMNQAASLANLILRVEDIPAVLNALTGWNVEKTNVLAGRLDLGKVGMSGHSFGAVTTEAVSGENLPMSGTKYTDPRIKAAILFSPSAPKAGSAEQAFVTVKIPWLLMTGTEDISPIGRTEVTSRLSVYPAIQHAPKYEVVLNKGEHSAFTDRALPGDKESRNPNHHQVILALSTAFWDAYLRGDAEALAWLNGSGPRAVMESADHWRWSVK